MERFIATTGGRPVKNQDLLLTEQVTLMLESLVAKLGQEIIIVSGCDITTGSTPAPDYYDVSSGIIWYDGKFWLFDALNEYFSSSGFSIDLVKSVIEDTPRAHFDGVVRDTIEVSKLIETNGTPDVVFDYNTPRLEDWLNKATVFRGDSDSDFVSADLTINNTDQILDLSSIVPVGAKSVRLYTRLTATGGTDSATISFKKVGFTYVQALLKVDTTYPTIWDVQQIEIELNANREIEYTAFEGTGVTANIQIKVLSWSF